MKIKASIALAAAALMAASCMPQGPRPTAIAARPSVSNTVEGTWADPNGIISTFQSGTFTTRTTDSNQLLASGTYVSVIHEPRMGGLGDFFFALSKRRASADGTFNGVVSIAVPPNYFERFYERMSSSEGMGGPEIPLDQAHVEGVTDAAFTKAYVNAAGVLAQLDDLSQILDHMPLAMPVNAAGFDRSSGFGARLDPFTRRYAFHPGIDFAGPWGAQVKATAPGTVVFAGARGGYGNMVEVDHGFGLHTRYGHLSAITVRVGMRIAKGAGLGRVGSTGRSTGPHVHYEVLYDNAVRNPANFIEAGRHVL